jgi:hypothetical protein
MRAGPNVEGVKFRIAQNERATSRNRGLTSNSLVRGLWPALHKLSLTCINAVARSFSDKR